MLRKERQDKGDEEREQKQILEQVERAQRKLENDHSPSPEEAKLLQRKEGEKVKLSLGFGQKESTEKKSEPPQKELSPVGGEKSTPDAAASQTTSTDAQTAPKSAVKLSFSASDKKPKNVFAAAAKKNPLAGKKGPLIEQPKKMTEQERIMKQEMEAMERKRARGQPGFPGAKRQRIS